MNKAFEKWAAARETQHSAMNAILFVMNSLSDQLYKQELAYELFLVLGFVNQN
jgi:hypothetical protein